MIPRRQKAGPFLFIVVVLLAIGAVLWGRFAIDPEVTVFDYETRPITALEVGDVTEIPEIAMFVVILDEAPGAARFRVVDGLTRSTGCSVRFDPLDMRFANRNPNGKPGSFTDPCSGAVWVTTGDAVSGTSQPLRTPAFIPHTDAEGRVILNIEVIGRPDPRATPTPRPGE